MRIVVRGPHVQTWVNGVQAVDYVDPQPKFTDGVIALQLHSGGEGRMRFKDIVSPRDPVKNPRRRHQRDRLVRERAHQGLREEPAHHACGCCTAGTRAACRANLARYGVDVPEARFTKRYEDLLESDDVDIVSITTPNHLHAAQAVAAARAGKHFVLEKPTGLDTRELAAIRDAVRKAKVRTIVSFELHYNPYLRFVHWLRASGRLGSIRFARLPVPLAGDRLVRGLEMGAHEASGRSHLLAAGCHAVDALRWCSGLEPLAVSAFHTRFTKGYRVAHHHRGQPGAGGKRGGARDQLHRLHAALHFRRGADGGQGDPARHPHRLEGRAGGPRGAARGQSLPGRDAARGTLRQREPGHPHRVPACRTAWT